MSNQVNSRGKKNDEKIGKELVLSLIGNVLERIGISSLSVIGNISSYLISYLRYFEPESRKSITLQHTYFILSVISFTRGLFVPFLGTVESKIGIKGALLLSAGINTIGSLILCFSKNFFIDLFIFFMFSIGTTLNSMLSTRNILMYFNKKRGFLSGILSLVSSLFYVVFNYISEKVINPKGEDTVDNFYPFEVSQKVILYYYLQTAFVGVTSLIEIFLIVPFVQRTQKKIEEENTKKEELVEINENEEEEHEDLDKYIPKKQNEKFKFKDRKISKSSVATIGVHKFEKANSGNNFFSSKSGPLIRAQNNYFYFDLFNQPTILVIDNKSNTTRKKLDMKIFKTVLKSGRIWRLFLIGLFSCPLNNFICLTWRPVGITEKIPTKSLQLIGGYLFIVTSVSTLFFSFLSDKISFKFLYSILSGISVGIGLLFCHSFKSPLMFTLLILLNSFVSKGKSIIAQPHYMRVFGMGHYLEIGGLIALSHVFMSPLCSFFAYCIEKYIGDKNIAYHFMFSTGGILCILPMILSICETEEEFDFDEE